MVDNHKSKVDKMTGKRKNLGFIYKGRKFRVKNTADRYMRLMEVLEDSENVKFKELRGILWDMLPDFMEFIKDDEKIQITELFAILVVIINIMSNNYEYEYFELNAEFFRGIEKSKQETGIK